MSQERGRRRKEALLEAAAALLEEGGFGQVTHRAVASRAGLPLAATTYYFASRDDLIAQAFTRLADRDLADVRAALSPIRSPDPAAEIVAALLPRDRDRQLALWELYFQAGRDRGLRPLVQRWNDGYHTLITDLLARCGHPHTPDDVRLVLATLDGLLVEAIIDPRPDAMVTAVRRVLHVVGHGPRREGMYET